MKPYPAYKDSGVDWIGEIPEHWDLLKISRAFQTIGSGTTPKSDNLEYFINGKIPWINTGDLNDNLLTEVPKFVNNRALEEYSTLKKYPRGTLLIAMYGATIGKISVLGMEACTNQACCAILDSQFIDIIYAFYWFLSNRTHLISLGYGAGQPNISQEIIRSSKILSPPPSEQQRIISYLDHKTSLIDRAIAAKKRKIELLHEYRTALINQAVTRGLDPDVPMKDSGIEWLGEIPEHWELGELKRFAIINPSKNLSLVSRDSAQLVTFLPMENVEEDGRYNTDLQKPIDELWQGYTYFEIDDVIVAKITPCFENGKSAHLDSLGSKVGFGSTEFHVLRSLENKSISRFLFYLIKTHAFRSTGEVFMQGAAGQKRVPTSFVESFIISLPSLREQQDISTYLDKKTKDIDRAIALNIQQISELLEYRTSLISSAVTGKIDVREWEQPLEERIMHEQDA